MTRKAASVAALSVLVITAGGIAYAESSLGTTTTASTNVSTAASTTARTHAHGLRARALHGEFVVQTKKGFVTLVLARGTVTAVSSTSISVKSADGVTTTFAVTSKTRVRQNGEKSDIGAVHDGDMVGVLGTKGADGSLTARVIRDPHGASPAAATTTG